MKRSFKKKNQPDPVDAFMDDMLKRDGYAEYYCSEHGKQLIRAKFAKNGRPCCPQTDCQKPLFTPEEWAFKQDVRAERKRRVQILRNHLED